MWTSVCPVDVDSPAPSARSKHSATLIGEHVYLLGGRNGNLPMKDFWRYNLVSGKWHQLKPAGDKLPCLQEHSAVAYKDNIYVFGGEVGFSAGTETPLWSYDIRNNSWRKIRSKKGVATPKGRRGHSALIHRGSMLIYGGYQDLRGSCSDLWAYHFETESWHLLSTVSTKSSHLIDSTLPPPRHKHSAVLHDDSMYIYGGMTDLQERSDLWKWDTHSKSWTNIKTKINPGPLHSHAVCKLPSSMLIFGGEKSGHPVSELWKFTFATELWEKIIITGTKPQPRSESIAFTVSELLLTDPESKAVRIRSRTCYSSAERGSRHSSYLPNNRVAPCEKTYVFQPSQANYTDGSDLAQQYAEKSRTSFLQEISKISQIAKLNNKCTYTVLTGCATDSTESLLKQHASPPGDRDPSPIPTPTRLVKSKSAYVIKKRDENSKQTCRMGEIPREPISVPNFSVLTLPQPVLTPVEATKLVYLDTDDENDLIGDVESKDELKPVRREETSYSSHLGYADNPLYEHMINSSSNQVVKFHTENVSSTSDYASIETMNRLSSASNYSVKTPQEENQRNRDKDGPFGFCNPNYLGPDIKGLIEEKGGSEEELLELQEVNGGNFNKNTKVFYSRGSAKNRPLRPLESNQQKHRVEFKGRALSASRAERKKGDGVAEASFDRLMDVPLYVYVIGGKEQGQVTVFQRPISMWKLKLF